MLLVWAFCVLAFFGLPFVLVGRTLSVWGFVVLALFIGAFVLGSWIRTLTWSRQPSVAPGPVAIDLRKMDWIYPAISLVTVAVLSVEFVLGDFLNLSQAWEIRAERAGDLLQGQESQSSALFQVAFILYPAAYAVLVRELLFRKNIILWRVGLFGGLPILMMSLVMGGRGPLLYAILLSFVAFRTRSWVWKSDSPHQRARLKPSTVLYILLGGVIGLAALNYFVIVFFVRAESAGGVEAMFDLVSSIWGVDFEGPFADLIISTIGYGNTYLVFVFAWYLVQGLVMSNVIFTDFVTPPHYGIYGLELFTAVMRRVNGEFVADRFYPLLELNVAGFLPSAWGSLYVDWKFWGLIPALIWGYLAAHVYHRCRDRVDPRWFFLAPLVSLGIFFSLINTPLGFGNGLVTHFWTILGFSLMRATRVTHAQVARSPHPAE
jgi:oligosaccharide repeat unit polymerase